MKCVIKYRDIVSLSYLQSKDEHDVNDIFLQHHNFG
jgi:hypothetical protein